MTGGVGKDWSAEVRKRLGKNLRHLRKAKGWTIYDVATRSDIAWHTIHNWECGKNSPSVDALIWLCRKIGWRLGDVLRGCNVNSGGGDDAGTE